MSDVFISYSRKDMVFARRLFERLGKERLDSWADWEDIPYSTEWWREICKGVEDAHNFVCILSPSYLTSKICNEELAYARRLHKRIIPVVRRELRDNRGEFVDEIKVGNYGKGWSGDAEENEGELRKLNYIFFRKKKGYDCQYDEVTKKVINPECDGSESDADDFEKSFLDLLSTARQDPAHVANHTRLTMRAIEWDSNGRKTAYGLRDEDLRQAEIWLAASEGKQPLPTGLQEEYISASIAQREHEQKAEQDRHAHELELAHRAEEAEHDRAARYQRWAVIIGVLLILAIIGIVGAVLAANEAANRSSQAQLSQQTSVAKAVTVEFQATMAAVQEGNNRRWVHSFLELPAVLTTLEPIKILATASAWAVPLPKVPVVKDFDGVTMVQVPSGCFMMGSAWFSDELPVHRVCFDEQFWIDRYEVTDAQFDQHNGKARNPSHWVEPNRPRTNITWAEARDYCKGRSATINGEIYRLPTETEWEYAARGPHNVLYPWGNDYSEGNVASSVINRLGGPLDVGSMPNGASWVGAFDMSGNVWEWVSTIYDQKKFPYHDNYDPSDGREDTDNPASQRVTRGGVWNTDIIAQLRTAYRQGAPARLGSEYIGFRCVRSE